MRKLIKRQRKKPGLSPGTLIHVGDVKKSRVDISYLTYNDSQVVRQNVDKIEDLPDPNDISVTWIQINGIHDIGIIESIGKRFSLHPLLLEDILNTEQRPKIEDYTNYLFLVLKTLNYDESLFEVKADQIALIIGKNYLISFHENENSFFDPIRERIGSGRGRIRKMKSDYLSYALMDLIIDNYFMILERIGIRIEELEQTLIKNPSVDSLHKINFLKREIIFLRKNIWPVREIVTVMERRDSSVINQQTGIYLRDLYDHTVQVIETIETMRDILASILDIYLSSINNKTNEIIKVLTIIATIFIPLTFIVGIYGMNFSNMPELEWWFGYPAVMIFMAILIGSMLIIFKRKRWI